LRRKKVKNQTKKEYRIKKIDDRPAFFVFLNLNLFIFEIIAESSKKH